MDYRELWFNHNQSDHGWYTCSKCGKKIRKADVDIDHIVPQKHGGKDKLYNLQCLCKHCNRSKQDSMKDTLPDLYTTNKNRVVKVVKENIRLVKKRIVEGVKSIVKGADDNIPKDKDAAAKKTVAKRTADTKKESTAKKSTTAKKTTATKKTTTKNKK